jgi:single-strand DNA-binding protein
MSSFNKVILMGNLTRDPELRFTNTGMAICNIGLAVNRKYPDQNGQMKEEVNFIDVTIFGKRGEAFAKFHTKGKPAFIEGRLKYDTWEDKNGGGKRSKLTVVGENWEFVGGTGGGGGARAGGSAGGEPQGASPEGEFSQAGPAADDTPF